jgi:hypothetical protein
MGPGRKTGVGHVCESGQVTACKHAAAALVGDCAIVTKAFLGPRVGCGKQMSSDR